MTIAYSYAGTRISTETMFGPKYFYNPDAGMKQAIHQRNARNL